MATEWKDAGGKTGITVGGAFNATIDYEILTVVTYDTATYLSIAQTGKALPTDTTKWLKICEKGEQGVQGAKGNTGATGEQGIQGIQGNPGTNTYTWIRYSTNSDGTGFDATPTALKKYMGVYYGSSATAPTNKASYTWVKYIGEDGQGAGDMLKSTYDTDNSGLVDDSKKLGGQLPAYYQPAISNVTATASDIADTDNFLIGAKKALFSLIKSKIKAWIVDNFLLDTLDAISSNTASEMFMGALAGKQLNSNLSILMQAQSDILSYIDDMPTNAVRNVVVQGESAQWITNNDYGFLLIGTFGKFNTGISFMLYQAGVSPYAIYVGKITIASKTVTGLQKVNTSAFT